MGSFVAAVAHLLYELDTEGLPEQSGPSYCWDRLRTLVEEARRPDHPAPLNPRDSQSLLSLLATVEFVLRNLDDGSIRLP